MHLHALLNPSHLNPILCTALAHPPLPSPLTADRETGRPRGFGFVTMDAQAAQAACNELNETDYNGRQIKVREADPPGE